MTSLRRSEFIIFIFLTIALFGSNFILSQRFGLYEDDLVYYRNAFNMLPSWYNVEYVAKNFLEGRPLYNFMQIFTQLIIYVSQSLFVTYLACCVMLSIG